MSRSLARHVLSGALVALGLTATSLLPASAQQPTYKPKGGYKADQILVKFKAAETEGLMAALHSKVGAKLLKKFRKIDWQQIKLPPGISVEQALAQYRAHPAVEDAEPNYAVHALATPNDSRWSSQWDMAKIGAPTAWNSTTGSSNVVVAVIDTGVDYNHPDLQANMWRNPGEVAGDGRDNDGNGYVDDIYGINTAYGTSNPMDDDNHGTHVAGTIGAVGNNGVGVAGVNWNVKIMALKFLDSSGSGYDSDAITCLEYVITMKQRGVNIVATNNSWGGGGSSSAMKNAFDAAYNAGVLGICAAGNNGQNNDVTPDYPASYTSAGIISVAASDSSDNRPSWSHYGATSVDLAAPGVSIPSTLRGNAYGSYSGTSMAAPHVAGAVGLLASYNGGLSAAQLKQTILNSVDVLPQWQGLVLTGGRLNLVKALGASASPVLRQPDVKIRNTSELADAASGDNVYNTTGASQTRSQTITNGATANFRITVQNDGEQSESFVITGPATASGWTVAYFDVWNNNITSAVTGSGWTTPSLAAGAAIEINVSVTASSPTVGSRSILVTATSQNNTSKKDAVAATVSLPIQPDLLIRNGSQADTQYGINNVYQSTPAGEQVETVNVKIGTKTTFKVQLQNDSSSKRTFILKVAEINSRPAAWKVEYKNSGGNNILSPLRGSGYVSKSLSPGASEVLTIAITALSGKGLVAGDSVTLDTKAHNDSADVTANTTRDAVRVVVNIEASSGGTTTTDPAPTQSIGVDALIRNFGTIDFVGSGIIRTDGSGQTLSQDAARNQVVTYYIRLKNTGTGSDNFKFLGSGGGSSWQVKYYDEQTNAEITSAVVGGSWSTPTLAAAASYDIRLQVMPTSSASIGGTKTITMTASSKKDSNKKDVVKATTKVVSTTLSRQSASTALIIDSDDETVISDSTVPAILRNRTVLINFAAAGIILDELDATEPFHYLVNVDGKPVEVTDIEYDESEGVVTIALPVQPRRNVVVQWSDLPTIDDAEDVVTGSARIDVR